MADLWGQGCSLKRFCSSRRIIGHTLIVASQLHVLTAKPFVAAELGNCTLWEWSRLEMGSGCKIPHMIISWGLPAASLVLPLAGSGNARSPRDSELLKLPWVKNWIFLTMPLYGPHWNHQGSTPLGLQACLISGKMWGSQVISLVVWLSLTVSKSSLSNHLCFPSLWVCKHHLSLLTNTASYHVKQRTKTVPLFSLRGADDYILFTRVHQRLQTSCGKSYLSPCSHGLWQILFIHSFITFLPPFVSFLPSFLASGKEDTSVKTTHSSL